MKKLKGSISKSGYMKGSPHEFNDFNIIPGSSITMKGVKQDLKLIPIKLPEGITGKPVVAKPGKEYKFPNFDAVLEIPTNLKKGGAHRKHQKMYESDRARINEINPPDSNPNYVDPYEYLSGGPTTQKAKEILRDGTVHGKPLTDAQKGFFGWIAGGRKQYGGNLDPSIPYLPTANDLRSMKNKKEKGGPALNSLAFPVQSQLPVMPSGSYNAGPVPGSIYGMYQYGGSYCPTCDTRNDYPSFQMGGPQQQNAAVVTPYGQQGVKTTNVQHPTGFYDNKGNPILAPGYPVLPSYMAGYTQAQKQAYWNSLPKEQQPVYSNPIVHLKFQQGGDPLLTQMQQRTQMPTKVNPYHPSAQDFKTNPKGQVYLQGKWYTADSVPQVAPGVGAAYIHGKPIVVPTSPSATKQVQQFNQQHAYYSIDPKTGEVTPYYLQQGGPTGNYLIPPLHQYPFAMGGNFPQGYLIPPVHDYPFEYGGESDNDEDVDTMKKGGNWIKGAVNPAHKGYCSPMTKATCTPRRKAFARMMKEKHGFHKKQFGGESVEQYYNMNYPEKNSAKFLNAISGSFLNNLNDDERDQFMESYRQATSKTPKAQMGMETRNYNIFGPKPWEQGQYSPYDNQSEFRMQPGMEQYFQPGTDQGLAEAAKMRELPIAQQQYRIPGQVWSEAFLAGTSMLGSAIDNATWTRNQRANQYRFNADSNFLPTQGYRGDYMQNSGMFRPDQMTPVQFPGQGPSGYGFHNLQQGGQYSNGEYYLSDSEIENIKRMGGTVEYLD